MKIGEAFPVEGGDPTPSDLPVIALRQVGPEAASLLSLVHHAAFAGKEPWDEAAFRQILEMPGVVAWLACVEDRLPEREMVPAGFIITRYVLDEGEILSLAVHPHKQRRGVARTLLQHVLKQVQKGRETLFLEVRVSNQAAATLYEHAGFQQVAVRSRYYEDGEDARLLRWLPE